MTNPHPKEHHMSAITDEAHKLLAALEAEGHHLADVARSLLAKLKGDEQQLAADVHNLKTAAPTEPEPPAAA